MSDYRCESCGWSGSIETESEPNTNRQSVESDELDHCPICGTWGLVKKD